MRGQKKERVKADKSANVLFSLREGECQLLTLYNTPIPNKDCIKNLGMHLIRRLIWKQDIWNRTLGKYK